MKKQSFLEVIQSWQSFWMNQTQNNEEDRKNYFSRAIGVDANMRHNLADLLADHCEPLEHQIRKLQTENKMAKEFIKHNCGESALARLDAEIQEEVGKVV